MQHTAVLRPAFCMLVPPPLASTAAASCRQQAGGNPPHCMQRSAGLRPQFPRTAYCVPTLLRHQTVERPHASPGGCAGSGGHLARCAGGVRHHQQIQGTGQAAGERCQRP